MSETEVGEKPTYPILPKEDPKVIVVHCVSPRIHEATTAFIEKELGLKKGEYAEISLPGGVSSLSSPLQLPKDFKVVRDVLSFCLEHFPSVERVILINHEGCSKYKVLHEDLGPIFLLLAKTLPARQLADLKHSAAEIAKLATELGLKPIVIQRFYAKFANSEKTLVTFEEIR